MITKEIVLMDTPAVHIIERGRENAIEGNKTGFPFHAINPEFGKLFLFTLYNGSQLKMIDKIMKYSVHLKLSFA